MLSSLPNTEPCSHIVLLQALQRYQHDFSAPTWLHRLISKDEERHHNYILEKSENALKQLQGKDDFKLRGLQEKIENFCQERKELMVGELLRTKNMDVHANHVLIGGSCRVFLLACSL